MHTISVIIPTYNSALFIARAITSIQEQHYPVQWQIIVVDDGSTDHTSTLIRDHYPFIHYIHQSNQGPAAARNAGLEAASGEWITFLDADDYWPSDRTQLLMQVFAANPQLLVTWGLVKVLFEDPEEAGRWKFVYSDQQRFDVNLGARLFRREAFERIGLFDASMRYCEDADWFYRAKEAALPMQAIEQCTLYYNVHAHGITHQQDLKQPVLLALKKSLDRRRNFSIRTLPKLSDYSR